MVHALHVRQARNMPAPGHARWELLQAPPKKHRRRGGETPCIPCPGGRWRLRRCRTVARGCVQRVCGGIWTAGVQAHTWNMIAMAGTKASTGR